MPLTNAPSVTCRMILCDAAQAEATGKLHMLGAGWSVLWPPIPATAVALLIQVPWDRTNQVISLVTDLVDSDGHPVTVPGANGEPEPVRATGQIEMGRPPGVKPGTELSASFVVNVPSLPLGFGRYTWRVSIDGEPGDSQSFEVIPLRP